MIHLPKPLAYAIPVLASLLLAACGGDKGTGGDGGDLSGPISARIDGKAWASNEMMTLCQTSGSPGGLLMQGSRTEGNAATSLVFTLYNIKGPGTYPLGVANSVFGGILGMSIADGKGGIKTWLSPMTGLEGSITFTKVGADGVAGKFDCKLKSTVDTAGEFVEITDGKFDLPLKGTLAPVPDNVGSRVVATLNDDPFESVTVTSLTAAQLRGPGLQFTAISGKRVISMTLMEVVESGTYSLKSASPVRTLGVTAPYSGAITSWGVNGMQEDEGEVIVTSLTATRAKGTFSATLRPQLGATAAPEPMVVTGEFDIGIP